MRIFYIVFLICFLIFEAHAKDIGSTNKKAVKYYKQAEEKFHSGEINSALELLEKALKIDDQFFMAHFAMADIYHSQENIDKEISHLEAGLSINSDAYPKRHYFLAEAFYNIGEYHKAGKHIDLYFNISENITSEEKRFKESCDFAVLSVENPSPFKPVNLGASINSSSDEYWPVLNAEGNRLMFTRLISRDENGNKLGYPQEDFYFSEKKNGKYQNAIPLGRPVNTKGNEGAQCISPDGRLLIFTACERQGGIGRCDIYISVLKDGKWTTPINIGQPVNSVDWESQPSISADGNMLYFVSNRKGGKGKKDIWRAEKTGVTKEGYPIFGRVENLEEINTPGNEMAPFIHADGKTLYFSSDYLPGMGGNDLFMTKLEEGNFSTPVNLGFPINTLNDEEGLFVDVSGNCAYYNSGMKGFGGRDIFSFELPDKLRPVPVSYVKGQVTDAISGKRLSVDVLLNNLTSGGNTCRISQYENDGEFLICLPVGNNYGLTVEQKGYLFCSANFNLTKELSFSEPYLLDIKLQPVQPGIYTVLNNVFFESDSFELKMESFHQLDEVVRFLKINPSLVIEIGGHTDNVGTEEYNLALSEKRAGSVVQYLKDKGVNESRLSFKGYGFSKPVADNSSENGRELNRRTEFKIVEK